MKPFLFFLTWELLKFLADFCQNMLSNQGSVLDDELDGINPAVLRCFFRREATSTDCYICLSDCTSPKHFATYLMDWIMAISMRSWDHSFSVPDTPIQPTPPPKKVFYLQHFKLDASNWHFSNILQYAWYIAPTTTHFQQGGPKCIPI